MLVKISESQYVHALVMHISPEPCICYANFYRGVFFIPMKRPSCDRLSYRNDLSLSVIFLVIALHDDNNNLEHVIVQLLQKSIEMYFTEMNIKDKNSKSTIHRAPDQQSSYRP